MKVCNKENEKDGKIGEKMGIAEKRRKQNKVRERERVINIHSSGVCRIPKLKKIEWNREDQRLKKEE